MSCDSDDANSLITFLEEDGGECSAFSMESTSSTWMMLAVETMASLHDQANELLEAHILQSPLCKQAAAVLEGPVRPLAPVAAPRTWWILNAACFAGTAVFLGIALYCRKESSAYQWAYHWYIPFNMGVCAIWLLEALLCVLYPEAQEQHQDQSLSSSFSSSPVFIVGEVLLAGACVVDGIEWMVEWMWDPHVLRHWELVLWAAFDFCVYGYYLMGTIMMASTTTRSMTASDQQPQVVDLIPSEQEMMIPVQVV